MKDRKERITGNILLLLVFSCMIGLYLLLTLQLHDAGGEKYADPEKVSVYLQDILSGVSVKTLAITVIVTGILSTAFIQYYRGNTGIRKLLSAMHRYRGAIAILFVLLCVVFEINNTSLYQWTAYMGFHGAEGHAPFWGVTRGVRMDEWSVWSPLALSQQAAGYPAVSNLVAGGEINTAWISVGGIPAFSAAAVFKPFYWGFLLLGASRGYSLLFALRVALLFLVSYELARKYTDDNHPLSCAAALLITLSPYVQWWFSQSISEVLIFGQAMVLCFRRIPEAETSREQNLWALCFSWCFGCYAMIGYPAWILSGAYLIIPVCVYFAVRAKGCRRRLIRLVLPMAGCILILGIIIWQSRDNLLHVLNSAYPGGRLITGGDLAEKQAADLYSIFQPFVRPLLANESESASWITFVPAGIILSLYNMVKDRRADGVSTVILSVEIVFVLFALIGFPAWLARITLFSQINRPELVIGICDTVLLIRGLAGKKEEWSPKAVAVLASSCVLLHFCYIASKQTMESGLITAFVCIYLFVYLVLFSTLRNNQRSVRYTSCILAVIALLGGGFVNPLQAGIDSVTELDLVKELAEEGDKDSIWFVEGGYPVTNLPLIAGKRVLNSTQAYPDPEKWTAVDKDGVYKEKYNRFANVSSTLTEDQTSFSLIAGDHLYVKLNPDDLRALGIDYVLSPKEYTESSGLRLKSRGADGYMIYEVSDPETGRTDE